jgi:hypothetical protein
MHEPGFIGSFVWVFCYWLGALATQSQMSDFFFTLFFKKIN